MEIREMTISDYEEACALWQASPGVRLVSADSEEGISAFLQRNPGMSFSAVEQGQVVGTVLCGQDGRRGYIYHVAVKPEFRGQHVGTRLVNASLGMLRRAGIARCHVFVLADNPLGNAFWGSFWNRREDINSYSIDV